MYISASTSSTTTTSTTTTSCDLLVERCDSRAEILKEDMELASAFIQTLFSVLYEVYSSSVSSFCCHLPYIIVKSEGVSSLKSIVPRFLTTVHLIKYKFSNSSLSLRSWTKVKSLYLKNNLFLCILGAL